MPDTPAPRRPVNEHAAYHAHVYFDADTVGEARALCAEAGRLFKVAVGRVHEKNVGPHPRWSCQLLSKQDTVRQRVDRLGLATKSR